MRTHRNSSMIRQKPKPVPLQMGTPLKFQFYYIFQCYHSKRGCPCAHGKVGLFADGVCRQGEAWSFVNTYHTLFVEFDLKKAPGGKLTCKHGLDWLPPRVSKHDSDVLRDGLQKHKPLEFRNLLAGTTKDSLLHRIEKADNSFTGLLPSHNALRIHRRGGTRASMVSDQSILSLTKELGDSVVHLSCGLQR